MLTTTIYSISFENKVAYATLYEDLVYIPIFMLNIIFNIYKM